jgi:predicted nucleic acid-binding Zn ribbon protein
MKDKSPRICKADDPIDSKQVLEMVLQRLHISADNPKVAVGMNWRDIIGPRLFPHVKIVDIKGKTLVLRADHPSWAQIAMMQKKKVLAGINRTYPSLGIGDIQILST